MTEETLRTALVFIITICTAVIAFFCKRLVDRQDNLGKRVHRLESLVTALLLNAGLMEPGEGLPPLD